MKVEKYTKKNQLEPYNPTVDDIIKGIKLTCAKLEEGLTSDSATTMGAPGRNIATYVVSTPRPKSLH